MNKISKDLVGLNSVHTDTALGNNYSTRRKKIINDCVNCCKLIEKVKQVKKNKT